MTIEVVILWLGFLAACTGNQGLMALLPICTAIIVSHVPFQQLAEILLA